jgi:hypothetical protein
MNSKGMGEAARANVGYGQTNAGPRFITNPQKQTFDPRIIDQQAKMMKKMMTQGLKMMPKGPYPQQMPMMNQMHQNMPMMFPNGAPMQMMGYKINPQQMVQMPQMQPKPPQGSQVDQNQQKQSKYNPCSIFVKNIPANKNKIGTLAAYFSKFGEVTNVSVNSVKNTAVVKFEEPSMAKEAYMCEEPVMAQTQIQLVYNPGAIFSQKNADPAKNTPSPKLQAAPGSNLSFESEEIRKQKEAAQKKREVKKQRKEMIEKDNQQILKLVKELNGDLSEQQKKERKDKIAELKASMNQKLKEEQEEKKKEGSFKKKGPGGSKKFNSAPVKQKKPQAPSTCYSIVLKIVEDELKKS